MMGHRERLVGGAEHDAFSRLARRMTDWHPGEVKRIKQKFHRRVRRQESETVRAVAKKEIVSHL